jgi:hypothetical protein
MYTGLGQDVTTGSLYSQLIGAGVDPVDAEAYLTTGQLAAGSTGPISSAPNLGTEAAAVVSAAVASPNWLLFGGIALVGIMMLDRK